MNIERDGSFPVEVCWVPATPTAIANADSTDPKTSFENGPNNINRFNEAAFGIGSRSYGFENGVFDMNSGGMYDGRFLMNNSMWNTIPCSDLLALADAAITTKTEVKMHFQNQNQNHDGGMKFIPDSQQCK